MYLMYIYVYNEMFFPNHLSCEKANDRLAWQISFSITYPKALNLRDEISLRGKGYNIRDVTDTKTGSCHHKDCIAYLLSTFWCINLKQV